MSRTIARYVFGGAGLTCQDDFFTYAMTKFREVYGNVEAKVIGSTDENDDMRLLLVPKDTEELARIEVVFDATPAFSAASVGNVEV